jgi:hypothetical protein
VTGAVRCDARLEVVGVAEVVASVVVGALEVQQVLRRVCCYAERFLKSSQTATTVGGSRLHNRARFRYKPCAADGHGLVADQISF